MIYISAITTAPTAGSAALWLVVGALASALVLVPVVLFIVNKGRARSRSAEQRAQRAERSAEMGAMTGGLAHEIKNPLSTIGLNVQLLSETVEDLPIEEHDKAAITRRLSGVRREAERLRDTLEDFLAFAGHMPLHLADADLNVVVEEIADFFAPQADQAGVRMRVQLHPRPLRAQLDAAHIKQALLNLLINATQAMTADSFQGSRELLLRTAPGNPKLDEVGVISVIDTGPGMDEQTQADVFTPYFTTKAGGSGLGLPTTRRIIDEHAGRLTVHSELGKGTSFEIGFHAAPPRLE